MKLHQKALADLQRKLLDFSARTKMCSLHEAKIEVNKFIDDNFQVLTFDAMIDKRIATKASLKTEHFNKSYFANAIVEEGSIINESKVIENKETHPDMYVKEFSVIGLRKIK